MADFVFNIAKGSIAELVRRVVNNDPANSAIIVVPVNRGAATDATLKDLDTLSAVLAAVTERNGSGWERKTLTNADLSAPVVDDTSDWITSDLPNLSWTPTNATHTVTDLVVCYDADTGAGTESDIVPLTMHTFTVTPASAPVSALVAGFHRAA
jgi:hypothetical protein